ncbi:MAG TPA: acetolactate synthase large subunit, partial [Flavobacterium sp.]|nr:acetolactate synthase large subunit [Flavobacterium sp.]
PLLVITGQKPVRKNKQGKFQIVDVVRMMEPVTKFSTTIISAEKIPATVRYAVKTAEAERPGAVHLELPEDIALEEATMGPIERENSSHPNPSTDSVETAVAVIHSSRFPVLLVASGANRKKAEAELEKFVNKTGIPFITTQLGKGALDEKNPHYLGTTALSRGDYVHKILEKSDLIISVGHDTKEKPPFVFTSDLARTPKIIHINFSPADTDTVYTPTYEVVGDIRNSLSQIARKVSPKKSWDFSYFYNMRKAQIASINKNADSNSFPLIPERVVAEVEKIMPKDSIISLDNGMYKIWFTRNLPARKPNSLLLDNNLATMGAGLSVGMAAKLLHPEKKVLVIAGDGGFMMNVGELETAKRLNLDLVILILNDSGFGMIKWKQKDMDLPDFGLGFSNPDFVKLAESFGGTGYAIKNVNELQDVLEKTINDKGIHIIECPVSYSKTNDALGKNLKEEINRIR